MKIEEGKKVTVHYIGKLNDSNTEFDNSYTRNQPITFTIGNNEVIKGFESAVMNRDVDDKFEVMIPKNEAYGDYEEANIQTVDMDKLGLEESSLFIGGQLEATTNDGKKFMCLIKSINESEKKVELDMNHPLSGKDLSFEIEIIGVE